jgi:hypothetical protein
VAHSDVTVSRVELRNQLLLMAASVPEPTRSEIADKLVDELLRDPKTSQDRGPIVPSPFDKDKFYVIPGDDMGFAETAIQLTVGILGLLANPVPLISTIALLAFKFRRKSITLNAQQATVVLTLMNAPKEGWRVSEIASRLPSELALDTASTQRILEELRDTVRRGQPAPVVREWNGRWWANEIW